MRRALILLGILLVPIASLPAQQDEEAAVREVVNRYLHGLKFNDVESFKQAFMPDARLYFVNRDGSLGQLSQADWYRGFAASAGKEEQGELRIATLEVHRDIATVKVVEDYPGNPGSRYTDYLNMVKYGGRWWIVNKIYTSERL
ncbi:MAG TPA: nuclear transport factor 2 family protein [Gemmatimonadales bacterium]|nr:nuclear transport factor 2 family protein [Gemmatimonadales bacterium]